MPDKINWILLIDSDAQTNRFSKVAIEHSFDVHEVHLALNSREALGWIEWKYSDANLVPGLIFLDMGLPDGMAYVEGWLFLKAFADLKPSARANISLVMLCESDDPADQKRAAACKDVALYVKKPITGGAFDDILQRTFPNLI